MSLKIDISSEKLIKYGFCGIFFKGTIVDVCNALSLLIFGTTISAVSTIIWGISVFLLALGMLRLIEKEFTFIAIVYIFFGLLWIISGLMHPTTIDYLKENAVSFFLTSIPYMIFFYHFFNGKWYSLDDSLYFVYKISWVRTVIAVLVQTLIFLVPRCDVHNDYMVAGYTLLIPSVFVLMYCKYKKINLLMPRLISLVVFVYLFILGCRGALICYLLFYIACMFFNVDSDQTIKSQGSLIIKRIAFILLAFLLIALSRTIANFLIALGVSSRNLEGIVGGLSYSNSYRFEIYEIAWKSFLNNPLGSGIMYDRTIFPTAWNVPYTHNIVLELGVDFGIWGFLIFAIFIILFIYVIKKTNPTIRILLMALFCESVVRLMLSSSLWIDQMLYACIGVMIAGYLTIRGENRAIYYD